MIFLITKKKEIVDIGREERQEKTVEKKHVPIKEIVGRNLVTFTVTIMILIVMLPLILKPLFEAVWNISHDKDTLSFIYIEGDNVIAAIFEELIIVIAAPYIEAVLRIIKFLFLLVLIIIIIYVSVHSICNVFIQSDLKTIYVLIINLFSAIIVVSVTFFYIPYIDAFEIFIENLGDEVDEFDPLDLPGSLIDVGGVVWDYMIQFYEPIVIAIVMMFSLVTTLEISFKRWIAVDKRPE